VVHGLGGAGKTQVVLKTIEHTRDNWTHVLYVDATSEEAIQGTFQDFAKAQNIGKAYEDTIDWLGSRREQWLLVFDNADDPSLNIRDYFPSGTHGSILITTRLADLALLAQGPGSDCCISSMNQQEALTLLMKTARLRNKELSDSEMEAANALLKVCRGALDIDPCCLLIHGAGLWASSSRDCTRWDIHRTLSRNEHERV
jgi:hypothetical protein